MINKFVRYINQNKKRIIKIIAIIVFAFVILQLANSFFKNNNGSGTSDSKSNIKDNDRPTQSVITGEEISKEEVENNINIIKKFVNYCNNEEVEKAYDLLTNDCKEEFNNSLELFKTNYYNKIFNINKTYNLELWFNEFGVYVYKIKYYEDNLLATGGAGINDNIEDYITIISQNGQKKININGFIKKENINKSKSVNDVELVINSRKIYKSYETYNITIRNYTSNKITISDGENVEDICLLDKNDVEYYSFIEELDYYDLSLEARRQNVIDINFNKIYDKNRIIKKIKFSNINIENDTSQKINITIDI